MTVNLKNDEIATFQEFILQPHLYSCSHLAPAATAWLLQSHLGSYSHKLAIAAAYWLMQPLFGSYSYTFASVATS